MAKHISDFSKLPDEVVFDLINEQNGTALDNTMVTLGVPTETTGGVTHNTTILVTALPTSDYAGQVPLGYNRLDVQGFLFGSDFILPAGDATMYADLIPEINARMGTNITDDDFVNSPIGDWHNQPNETKHIAMQMKPTSKVFIGELTFTLALEEIPLPDVVKSNVLSGLVYQPPA